VSKKTLERSKNKTCGDLFGKLDIANIAALENFKEDSVREVIVQPLLLALGYQQDGIVRSKTLRDPFLKTGSKKRKLTLIPDYVLTVEGSSAWVLDAKSPNEDVLDSEHIQQVYSYAKHSEVRSAYFALCNGTHFALFRCESDKPVLHFALQEIEHFWDQLTSFLSPGSFHSGKAITYESLGATNRSLGFDYLTRTLLDEIPVRKQQAKRHFGVHGYFTKQTWNVVAEYIKNFSKPGDFVLDPFGGSGVTAIEAMMNNRNGIHIDLNPLAVFIVKSLTRPVEEDLLRRSFENLVEKYEKVEPSTEEEIKKALKKYPYPKNVTLPHGSDVLTVDKLFSPLQLARLATLKYLILLEQDASIRDTFLLMFSGLLNKVNLTYHASDGRSEGRGDSAIFRYYRYRIAPKPAEISILQYLKSRFLKVSAAKKEISIFINERTLSNLQIRQGTATKLEGISKESVDYIYTDPPYGNKIPYLDLSTMWNAWLDLKVSEEDFAAEAIEGGEHGKSKSEYNSLISASIKEMYRVLKFDRWMSFVFAHKDPEFWHLILESAEACGFEYVGAVPQKNGQTSFKKRQNPFTVLSGQLIINFKKVRNPRAIMRANLGMNISEIVIETIEGVIAKNSGATLEQINDELIIRGLELGFLDLLKKEYSDLSPILEGNFDYDEVEEKFSIRKNAKFRSHLDVRLRIRYYLISFLRRMERENKKPTFDEIIMSIIPLLKNGVTPPNQTVSKVLEDVAVRVGDNRWTLSAEGQQELSF
jgi:16S rRNA G966 N2-methylase RsmD